MAKPRSYYVYIIALVAILNSWGYLVISPAFPSIAAAFQVTPQELSLIGVAYSLPGVFLSPIFGKLSDRYGRRTLLLPMIGVYILGGVGAGLAPSFNILLLFEIIQGLAVSAFFPLAVIMLGDLFQGDDRGRAIGTFHAFIGFCSVPLPFIGGLLTAISWRFTFLSFLAILIILLVAVVYLPETNTTITTSLEDLDPNLPSNTVTPQDLSPVLSGDHKVCFKDLSPITIWVPIITVILMDMGFFMIFTGTTGLFVPFYVEEGLQLTATVTGIIQSILMLITAFTNILVGWLMAKRGKPMLTMASMILFAGGLFCFTFPPSVLMLVIAVALVGVGTGMAFPLFNAYILDLSPPQYRGIAASTTQAAIKLGQTIGPVLLSLTYALSNNSLSTPFLLSGSIISLLAVLCLPLIWHARKTGLAQPDTWTPSSYTPSPTIDNTPQHHD